MKDKCMDLVSILVPIYGVEKFIEKCAVSLFEQTYPNIEYVFVDDCTTDNSISVLRDIIAKYPDRESKVRILHHEHNRGLAAARNTAIGNAVGEYVMHVDSDDYLDIYAVEKSVNQIRKENADTLMFGMRHVFVNKIVTQCVKTPIDVKEYVKQLIESEDAFAGVSGLKIYPDGRKVGGKLSILY
ncbi:glycosyltransferase [Bacteroides thetaiotaomicron]|nr:glycosyltransferase family 2 protein [Bacteroides thetaiotaomicron]MCE9269679.1 glycosyltransferase [Bacteroides thetaiotaomicron]MCE9279249.1 glycosyltransferase [Bacteroides thetaiotaomicron]